MDYKNDMQLIITVVKKGWGDRVLKALADIGIVGGTVLNGRGRSSGQGLLGMALSLEKEVVLTAVEPSMVDEAMSKAVEAGELNTSGIGICMCLPLTAAFTAPSTNEPKEDGVRAADERSQ